MGVLYFCFMMFGAVVVHLPPPGWLPAGYTPESLNKLNRRTRNLTADEAIKTRQFWLLWTILFLNVTAGIGVLGQASPMIQELFTGQVTAGGGGRASWACFSLFNMIGRVSWSSLSDDHRPQEHVHGLLPPRPGPVHRYAAKNEPALGMLGLFVLGFGASSSACTAAAFATIPAYLRDIFGTARRAIHGRLLTAWSAAGIVGTVLVNYIREYQLEHGVSRSNAYTETMFIMAGLLVVGFICNFLIKAVDDRHHMNPETADDAIGVG